jgi:molecular chaperone IbpA
MTINQVPFFDPSTFAKFTDFEELFNRAAPTPGFPPYNIVKKSDMDYFIELAVAGFSEKDITVSVEDRILVVTGKIESKENASYIHKGIADRAFTRRFSLTTDVIVKSASLKDGMLNIALQRVIPEEKKPRTIPINGVTETSSAPSTKEYLVERTEK